MMQVGFLVDGFNLYHSILEIERNTEYCTKWLNINSLCKSYLHHLGKQAELQSIHYFTALPHHLTEQHPDRVNRHNKYLKCLASTGIEIHIGRFKEKTVFCKNCRTWFIKHEEKETDVALGVTIVELFFKKLCDAVVVVTGDTDLLPATEKCRFLFPDKKILFVFPYKRKNKELKIKFPDSFRINVKQYIKHQFPNPVVLSDREEIYKPDTW
jgi:uncharacterized LabA/DUF88 family protein